MSYKISRNPFTLHDYLGIKSNVNNFTCNNLKFNNCHHNIPHTLLYILEECRLMNFCKMRKELDTAWNIGMYIHSCNWPFTCNLGWKYNNLYNKYYIKLLLFHHFSCLKNPFRMLYCILLGNWDTKLCHFFPFWKTLFAKHRCNVGN